jgi:CHAT domain-containing protein/tetratricopeptide (TPR) repeat protein
MRQLLTLSFFFIFSYVYTYAQGAYTLADTALANRLMKEGFKSLENKKTEGVQVIADSVLNIFEQALGKETKEVAEALNLKALSLISVGKLDEPLTIYERALEIRKKIFGEKDTIIANSFNRMGSLYMRKGNYDKSIEFAQKALDILSKTNEQENLEIAETFNLMGASKSFKGDHITALNYHQKALDIRLKRLGNSHIDVAISKNNIGITYLEKGDIDKAVEYFQSSLDSKMSIPDLNPMDIGASLNNLAITYVNSGNFEKSLNFYQKALNIYKNMTKPLVSQVAVTFNNIGNVYITKGEFDKALEYFQKALDIRQKALNPEHPDIAISLFSLGLANRGLNNYEKAIDLLEKSLKICLKVYGSNGGGVSFCYSELGNCYNGVGDYDKAIEYFQKALEIKNKTLNANSPSIANSLISIGSSYENKKEYEKALENYQKAYTIFIRKDEKVQALNNLALLNIKLKNFERADSLYALSLSLLNFKNSTNLDFVVSLYELLNTLSLKADFEFLRFTESNNWLYLDKAKKAYQDFLNVAFYQNKTFTSEGSKFELIKKLNKVYERVIQINLIIANKEHRKDLFNFAFDNNEQGKSVLLKSQFSESNALKNVKIPQDLLKKEYDLRVVIASNEKKQQSLLNAGKSETDSTVLAISSKLFDLKQEYDALKQNLEKNYPEYYRLKYDSKTVSVEDVQKKLLSPRQTLLSYFVGDSSIFAFVVKLDTFAVYTIKKDFPLEMYVKQLREGLYGYQTAAVKTEKLYEAKADSFAQAAFVLHQKLIDPLSNLLTKEVVLVPDGVLGYIPFDILLSEKPKDATKFNTHHYFGKDHIISYNYSATLWQEMQNKKHKIEPTKNFVGFAPYYNGDTTVLSQIFANDLTMRKGLDSLKYSGEEVFKAQKLMGGESILDKKATKKTFEETASNYRIIHLATHGKANDKSGDYCFLAFTEQKDSIDNELLYVRDIYNLSLNADLVVLSACETGIGELKRGEGIVSLARAFAYSGAKSMVTSLWSVNDKSTMQIMENFYRNLRKGQTKNYALWKAKQDYWEKAKGELAHPFYWSSFIPIGDMKPVKMLP